MDGSAPPLRSAHALVALGGDELLLLGGELEQADAAAPAPRVADVWSLRPPRDDGWARSSCPDGARWARWECGATAGERAPTARSNHAAVAAGEHVLVFGGWSADGSTPLADAELLHVATRCWTRCATRGGDAPAPRGNPTLVYSPRRHLAVLYGGWNRSTRFGDAWCLDLEQWRWYRAALGAGDAGHCRRARQKGEEKKIRISGIFEFN